MDPAFSWTKEKKTSDHRRNTKILLREQTLDLMQEGITALLSSLLFEHILRQLFSEKGSNL